LVVSACRGLECAYVDARELSGHSSRIHVIGGN